MAADKQHAHELLDQLAPNQLDAVVNLLEAMVASEEDGDTLSTAERRAINEADEWLKHNRPIPHEEILAELGLTTTEWEKMRKDPVPDDIPRPNG